MVYEPIDTEPTPEEQEEAPEAIPEAEAPPGKPAPTLEKARERREEEMAAGETVHSLQYHMGRIAIEGAQIAGGGKTYEQMTNPQQDAYLRAVKDYSATPEEAAKYATLDYEAQRLADIIAKQGPPIKTASKIAYEASPTKTELESVIKQTKEAVPYSKAIKGATEMVKVGDRQISRAEVAAFTNLTGSQQFEKARELGLVPSDARYQKGVGTDWGYFLQSDADKAARDKTAFLKENIALPDGNYVNRKWLNQLEKEIPGIHTMYANVGFEAGNKALEAYNDKVKNQIEAQAAIGAAGYVTVTSEGKLEPGKEPAFEYHITQYLVDNPGKATVLKDAGFTKSQIEEAEKSALLLRKEPPGIVAATTKPSLGKTIIRAVTPWDESKETFIEYSKNVITGKRQPSQSSLKAQYEAEVTAPLWSKVLFGTTVVYDKRADKYYQLIMGEAPLAGAGKIAGAKKVVTVVKTIEINWNKLTPKAKPKIDWSWLRETVKSGKVNNAKFSQAWLRYQQSLRGPKPPRKLIPSPPLKSQTAVAQKSAIQAIIQTRAETYPVALMLPAILTQSQVRAMTAPQVKPMVMPQPFTVTTPSIITKTEAEALTQTQTFAKPSLRVKTQAQIQAQIKAQEQAKTSLWEKVAAQEQTQLKTKVPTVTKAVTITPTKPPAPKKPPVKPPAKKPPPTKPPIVKPPVRIPGPHEDKTDKEKRKLIKSSPGAFTFRMGEVGKKDVWYTYVEPYLKPEHKIIVVGRAPEGALIVRGPGSAIKTAQVLSGRKLARKVRDDVGFMDAIMEPISDRKGIRLSFQPDPKGLTTGDFGISRPISIETNGKKVFPLKDKAK